jgi:bacteriophage N4 adsorption protein B
LPVLPPTLAPAETGGLALAVGGIVLVGIDLIAREAMLFAAIGFLIGGVDDLLVDFLYGIRAVRHRLTGWREASPSLETLGEVAVPPMAIFVPAWDEAGVIGPMLATALDRLQGQPCRLYIGVYPNDRATIDEVARLAAGEPRIRLAVGGRDGPTTKADCLNVLWRALLRDEASGAERAQAIVLHDAEDVIDRDELRVYAAYLTRFDVVQLPVMPLVDRRSRMVSGHYADEFCESHAKQMLVRQAMGAAMPLAGVGCAIGRDTIERVAAARGGLPFDPTSLVEDYELGLAISAAGGSAKFARVRSAAGGVIAVRAYFPATLDAAVRQKARWMTGIALAGWDRIGWGRWYDLGDHWMRMRDRRAPLAMLVLSAAYVALIAWGVSLGAHALAGTRPTPPGALTQAMLTLTALLLAWRIVVRMAFVAHAYGAVEAVLSVPRMVVGNIVAILAARRALIRYIASLNGGGALRWDKTRHHFPDEETIATSRRA